MDWIRGNVSAVVKQSSFFSKPLADRTFFNNIEAIRDMFGIYIVCNRSTNEYYWNFLSKVSHLSNRN